MYSPAFSPIFLTFDTADGVGRGENCKHSRSVLSSVADHILQVEFDSPQALLKIKDGKLRSLVDESNDKDVLYAMAEKAHQTS